MKLTPHYALVPKDPVANLKFRRELLDMTGTDVGAQVALKKMCAEDLLFYVLGDATALIVHWAHWMGT